MYIVNRKETLQLVHLLQFYQGGESNIRYKTNGGQTGGILLMRLLVLYLKINFSLEFHLMHLRVTEGVGGEAGTGT